MGKRTSYERRERDFYKTPPSAVEPLIPFLHRGMHVWEPCAGDGALLDALLPHVGFVHGSDIEPQRADIMQGDAHDSSPWMPCNTIITNTPWPSVGSQGEPVVSLVKRWAAMYPTWLLLSADFAHNVYFAQLPCTDIVSVGRVSWMGNGVSGFDNAAWYRFEGVHPCTTTFHPRYGV